MKKNLMKIKTRTNEFSSSYVIFIKFDEIFGIRGEFEKKQIKFV